ncbi:hypothetical protein L7F22_063460 [Adiantum nelumboides]|nr:hypothetical protein [Adiantum nelumboides]
MRPHAHASRLPLNNEILKPIQNQGTTTGEGRDAFARLRLLLDRMMLRRTKLERADDMGLPPRTIEVRRDLFNEEEEELYESLYRDTARKIHHLYRSRHRPQQLLQRLYALDEDASVCMPPRPRLQVQDRHEERLRGGSQQRCQQRPRLSSRGPHDPRGAQQDHRALYEQRRRHRLPRLAQGSGVALNLTEASRVYLMDPWWNPSVEVQAMDRIHRLGQHRPIIVKRMVIENSIETRIIELQNKKSAMIEAAIGKDDSAMGRLSVMDLRFLFSL